jgi:hypothetical protein
MFLFLTASRQSLGTTKLPTERVPEALAQTVKRPGQEAGHSSPSTVKYKIAWSYDSIPACIFTALCLIKHRDKVIILTSHVDPVFGLCYVYCEDVD